MLVVCRQTIPHSVTWLDGAARTLSQIAEAVPKLSVGLATPSDAFIAYLEQTGESRCKAILRETVLQVEDPNERKRIDPLQGTGLVGISGLSGSIQRLTRDGLSEQLAQFFAEAVSLRSSADHCSKEEDDRARSAAERFLYERLESLAPTAGLFVLNQPVDFRFGPKAAKVDLACCPLRIAIEIDGYYHFQDTDAYRRDRRKDVELQRHGYLVLRFLADDVVARLEEVLDTILAAVALRRRLAQPLP